MRRIFSWKNPDPRQSTVDCRLETGTLRQRANSDNFRRVAKKPGVAFLRKDERGTAVTEFALISTVFLSLTLGFLDLARGVWIYNTLAYAAREGVRYAIVHGDQSTEPADQEKIKQIVKGKAIGLAAQKLTITAVWSPNNRRGSEVEVNANYNFAPLTPFFSNRTIVLRSKSRMKISN